MCLIIFKWQPGDSTPLILAANRDEFHNRPSLDAHYWEEAPHIFAGKDLEKNGTWLGVSQTRTDNKVRLAALTNFRGPDKSVYSRSRGEVTTNFLDSSVSAFDYAKQLAYSEFPGFNGLFYDGNDLVYCHHEANQAPEIYPLPAGEYGLSNAKLDTPWPKVIKSKQVLSQLNESDHSFIAEALFSSLSDTKIADDNQLPTTGVPLEFERMLSAAFIISPQYGTRTSTVVIIDELQLSQSVFFKERQFSASGDRLREQTQSLNFR
ncbi:MAG: NRDE family protein [Oleiphilus sp.]